MSMSLIRSDHIGETEPHAANLETEQRRDVTAQLHRRVPHAQVARVEIQPVVVLEHDFPLLAASLAWINNVGGVVVVEGVVEPTIGAHAEIQHSRIDNGRLMIMTFVKWARKIRHN